MTQSPSDAQSVTQTVVGSPGVYDRARNAIALTGGLPGWDRPEALAGLREAVGFADAVTVALGSVAPVLPEVHVSALGSDAVVDGCLAEGASLAWTQLIAALP